MTGRGAKRKLLVPRATHYVRAFSLAIPVICMPLLACDASAADCRSFGRDARSAIGKYVEALQRLEFEASDRLKGLDSRPFPFLRDEARKVVAIIADPRMLDDEEDLKRCRNMTWPIRKICADAARAFVDILDKHVASEKPEYDKAAYAQGIAACEKHMSLKPLKSLIRGSD